MNRFMKKKILEVAKVKTFPGKTNAGGRSHFADEPAGTHLFIFRNADSGKSM